MMADGASAMWMQRYARQGAEIVWGELTEMGKAEVYLLRPWKGATRRRKEGQ